MIISCEANFWKSDTAYGIPAEMFYRSTNNEECTTNENKFVLASIDSLASGRVQNYQLKKDCSRSFQTADSASTYICGVRYVNSPDSMKNDEIDRLNIKIDVHYGPISLISSALTSNEFNKTIKQGGSVTLKCPFEGNPIMYYWKQLGNDNYIESVGDRELVLSKTLAAGQYQYQCRAFLAGFIDTRTESVVFSVSIQENKATTKKGKIKIYD